MPIYIEAAEWSELRITPSCWRYEDTLPRAPDLNSVMRQLGPYHMEGTKYVSDSGSTAEHTTPLQLPIDPLPASPEVSDRDVPCTTWTVNVEA